MTRVEDNQLRRQLIQHIPQAKRVLAERTLHECLGTDNRRCRYFLATRETPDDRHFGGSNFVPTFSIGKKTTATGPARLIDADAI